MTKNNFKNIAFTYSPKQKNPFTGVWDNAYLVPAYKQQQGTKYNYIAVTCSPSMNGLYKWDASKKNEYKLWTNGKTVCMYIPIEDCTFIPFDELPDNDFKDLIIKEVKKQQKAWLNNQVKNRDYEYKKGKPDWML